MTLLNRIILMTLGGALLTATASANPAGPAILIVLSAEAAPYREAQKEIESQLAERRADSDIGTVDSTLLALVADETSDAINSRADLFIAIGADAVQWLATHLESSKGLIYCMASGVPSALKGRPSSYGVSLDVPMEQQFGLIAEALPRARTIGMLFNPSEASSRDSVEAARQALPAGWKLEAVAAGGSSTRSDAIETLLGRRVDVVWTAPDSTIYDTATIRTLLLTALRRKTPVFGFSAAFVRAGAVLGVVIDPQTHGRQASKLVHLAIKDMAERGSSVGQSGGNRSETPGPASDRFPAPQFEVAINLIVADRLGLALPESVVRRASQVQQLENGGKRRSSPADAAPASKTTGSGGPV